MRSIGSLSEIQSKKGELKAKVDELEKSLHHYRNRNTANQVRNRDHIMGEAVAQIQEVIDYLQTLAAQADILSVKYELESDGGK
ncbi:hypothetical protein Gotri_026850 [Gossypium trilobum]|uniref:Uncharacterized protein n=1 Tax=Gossypium trilobum TaxID=34281 RepID=A0A7J9FLU7_9ROSI|nr:hypothetical protein [Gossypium trilobum]